jgi:hypothetical protein
MADPRFDEATKQLFTLYGAHRFEEALAFAEEVDASHPDHLARTTFWRACLLSLNGRTAEALGALWEALERGAWWPASWLEGDPDLEGVRNDPAFEELVDRSEAATRTARRAFADRPEVRLLLPPGEPRALVLVLHMLGRTVEETEPHWRTGPNLGVAIALVGSTQRSFDGEPCWEFDDLVERDLSLAVEEASAAGVPSAAPLVLAGASQGGRRAVEFTLDPQLGAQAFVAIVPGVPREERLAPHLRPAAERRVRGWILTGEADWEASGAGRLGRDLSAAGVDVRLDSVPRLGHAYPEDFAKRLPDALDFVVGGRRD